MLDNPSRDRASLLVADCVAKLDEEQLAGNNRIGTNNFLNQPCALASDLESILLARALKIVLQHYRPVAPVRCNATIRPESEVDRTRRAQLFIDSARKVAKLAKRKW